MRGDPVLLGCLTKCAITGEERPRSLFCKCESEGIRC